MQAVHMLASILRIAAGLARVLSVYPFGKRFRYQGDSLSGRDEVFSSIGVSRWGVIMRNDAARPLKTAVIVAVAVVLTSCDPGIYKKPIQDFRDANRQLREAYFLQLDVARDAMVEQFTVQRKRVIWGNPALKGDAEAVQRAAEAIAAEREKAALNRNLLALRNKAFDTVDAYAGVLLALASDEDTNAIAEEVKGFAGDLEKLLIVAKEVKGISDVATRAADWLGPLGAAVSAFNEIFRLISAAARDRAIRDTIVAADPAIQQLFTLLAEEANYAQMEAQSKYSAAEQALRKQLKEGVVDNAAARELSETLSRVSFKVNQLKRMDDPRKLFDVAKEAQSGLVRKAAKPDYHELLAQVRAFKTQAGAVRQSLDALRNER